MQAENRDSLANTFIVATVLCLVCSFLVSAASLGLRSIQNRNVTLDRKQNLLQVAGFSPDEIASGGGIEELFEKRFEVKIIDLETGKEAVEAADEAVAEAGKNLGDSEEDVLANYDQVWASKSKKESVADPVPSSEDIIGIKYREKYSHVYIMKDEDGKSVSKYVFPVRGKGLWSMMKGFLAVEPDFQTIAGLTFYDQAETPGLGGEVMNPGWKAKWKEKKIYKGDEVAIEVVKGTGSGDYEVDGLSGATITSNGVSYMLEYWLGPQGFMPYINNQSSSNKTTSNSPTTEKGGSNG
jgi:Na+-transporting NADH:ubiquinone oxidoreductase subunit C